MEGEREGGRRCGLVWKLGSCALLGGPEDMEDSLPAPEKSTSLHEIPHPAYCKDTRPGAEKRLTAVLFPRVGGGGNTHQTEASQNGHGTTAHCGQKKKEPRVQQKRMEKLTEAPACKATWFLGEQEAAGS